MMKSFCIVVVLLLIPIHLDFTTTTTAFANNNEKKDEERHLVDNFKAKIVTQNQLDVDLVKDENYKSCDMMLYHIKSLQNKSSISELTRRALQVSLHVNVYSDLLTQRYDNLTELQQSGGPLANQELCIKQLKQLNTRAELYSRDSFNSEDVNLALLLDTYGRQPAGVFLGAGFSPGDYRECRRLTIETPDDEQVATRYCVAHLRHKSWRKTTLKEESAMEKMTVMKRGVCLPISCDSIEYQDKYEQLLNLMVNGEVIAAKHREQLELTDLYCLPDEESPLRSWWSEPKSVIVLVGLSLWLSLLLYATVSSEQKEDDNSRGNILKALSITTNLKLLFTCQQTDNNSAESNKKPALVDLKVIDGVKVVALIYVLMGHVIMCMMLAVDNIRETSLPMSSYLFTMANMAPAFAVNIFFAITGILTSYKMLRHSQSLSLISNPVKFIAFLAHRYLRLMPMYIIVVIYAKYLSKYAGSGPYWDYGTSEMSQRRICEQESWSWTLMLASNFKSPLKHCIPSAWYLADDFHFFLVAPFFISLLTLKPFLGKLILISSIVLNYWINFLAVITTDLDNLIPIAQFMPMGFKSYTTYMHNIYTMPQYRIGAYLTGLLFGFYLWNYEIRWEKYLADKKKLGTEVKATSNVNESPDWPAAYKRYAPPVSIFLMLLMFASPFISSQIPFNLSSARIMTALATPYYNIIYALAISFFVQLAATGNGYFYLNKLLSLSCWKVLARLSLCVCLINIEVINYLTQIRTRSMSMETSAHLTLLIVSILASYSVAAVLYVLFEVPIKILLNFIISSAVVSRKKEYKINSNNSEPIKMKG